MRNRGSVHKHLICKHLCRATTAPVRNYPKRQTTRRTSRSTHHELSPDNNTELVVGAMDRSLQGIEDRPPFALSDAGHAEPPRNGPLDGETLMTDSPPSDSIAMLTLPHEEPLERIVPAGRGRAAQSAHAHGRGAAAAPERDESLLFTHPLVITGLNRNEAVERKSLVGLEVGTGLQHLPGRSCAAPFPCRCRQAVSDSSFGGPPRRADRAAPRALRVPWSDRHQFLLELSAAKTYPGIRPGRNARAAKDCDLDSRLPGQTALPAPFSTRPPQLPRRMSLLPVDVSR